MYLAYMPPLFILWGIGAIVSKIKLRIKNIIITIIFKCHHYVVFWFVFSLIAESDYGCGNPASL